MDKPKFNLLDGIIVLLIVAIAAAGVFLLTSRGNNGAAVDTQNIQAVFSVQFTKVDKSVCDKFKAAMENDESVWVGIKERFEGKLVSVECGPSTKLTTNLRNGKAYLAEDPTTYDVTVTINAPAVETDSAISASGMAIRVGEETSVRGKGFAGFGFVTGLETAAKSDQQ